ncbi:MAG TPA: DNA-binding protein [Synergistaceae bacterium]|nr:DNA-binding protein [Synergistaceae bacterium]HPJ24555.1 DNA-binding protein [Synergistaceae bacterium]HPQ36312.1 DNA-binding protein [Synergistaceae bacterium]
MQHVTTQEIVALRLAEGDEVVESIIQACKDGSVNAAVILGAAGMVRDVTFAWFDGTQLVQSVAKGPFDITSLGGSVSVREQSLFVHMHGSMSGEDHVCIGGDIRRAISNTNLEVFLLPLEKVAFVRKMDGWLETLHPQLRGE